MAGPFATITRMKDFTNIILSDQQAEERLKPFLLQADGWFLRTVRSVTATPVVDDDAIAICSQYAAGQWELQNSSDKSKVPANLRLAEAEAEKWKANHTGKTQTTGGSYSTAISSQMLNNIPGMTDSKGAFFSKF